MFSPARSWTRGLSASVPDWKARAAPLDQPVTGDDILMLSAMGSRRIPDVLVTRNFHNRGCYIVRLGHVVKWLADEAEALGVEIFRVSPARSSVRRGRLGPRSGDRACRTGQGRRAEDTFQLGMELHRPLHDLRRRLPRPSWQAAARTLQADRGPGPAELRHRHQGTVGGSGRRPSPASSCTPSAGRWSTTPMAAASSITWRTTWSRLASSSASTTPTRI